MLGNDIGDTVHKHVACMFEHLIMEPLPEPEAKKGLFGFRRKKDEELTEEEWVKRQMRLWKPNDLPLKSLIHMTTKLGISVEVYTYMDPLYVPYIESWLARKGATCAVWAYYDVNDLYDDFKYNRDVHTMYTTSEEDARVLGMRSTVVLPDRAFGI